MDDELMVAIEELVRESADNRATLADLDSLATSLHRVFSDRTAAEIKEKLILVWRREGLFFNTDQR